MQGIEGLEVEQLNLGTYLFGTQHPLLNVNVHTIINTWVALLVLLIILIPVNWWLKQKGSMARFVTLSAVQGLQDLMIESLGAFHYRHFMFIGSLFIFILSCNWVSLIPGIEEPTADLNTTLALGIIAFCYKEYYTLKTGGLRAYLKEFTEPLFIMFPINIIGHLSKIVSIAFRLFGNIFGGSIITQILGSFIAGNLILETVALISGFNFLLAAFFTLFEGAIQAFVFMMLSLTYLSLALQHEEEV